MLLRLPPHRQRLSLFESQQRKVTTRRKGEVKPKSQTDWMLTSTPADASNTATAPSRTRSARSTSSVKSTCPAVPQTSQWLLPSNAHPIILRVDKVFSPGVSIRFIRWLFQSNVTAADWMVMPRSLSWAMKSVTVSPSSTSNSSSDRNKTQVAAANTLINYFQMAAYCCQHTS